MECACAHHKPDRNEFRPKGSPHRAEHKSRQSDGVPLWSTPGRQGHGGCIASSALRQGLPLLAPNRQNQLETLHLKKQRSEEHTSELQSPMRISHADLCTQAKKDTNVTQHQLTTTQTLTQYK